MVEADLKAPEGVADAEAFFERMLGANVKPSEDGETALKLVCAAEGISHQASSYSDLFASCHAADSGCGDGAERHLGNAMTMTVAVTMMMMMMMMMTM